MTRTEARKARFALAAMFAANGALMGAWAPQIPLLLPRHGIGETVLGLLILALGLGAISAMLFAGRLIARHGSVPVLRVLARMMPRSALMSTAPKTRLPWPPPTIRAPSMR